MSNVKEFNNIFLFLLFFKNILFWKNNIKIVFYSIFY